jgi:hypothetical protein
MELSRYPAAVSLYAINCKIARLSSLCRARKFGNLTESEMEVESGLNSQKFDVSYDFVSQEVAGRGADRLTLRMKTQ